MGEKQKRKNSPRPIYAMWEAIKQGIRQLQILSMPLIAMFLIFILILLHTLDNFGSVYWVYSLPQRIIPYIIVILIVCVLYILKKRLSHSAIESVARYIPLRTKLMGFVSILLVFYFVFSIYVYPIPAVYTGVLRVEYDGLHSYSLQYTASDYAEYHTHYYEVYECYFDLFCYQIYSVPKYGMAMTVETIDFEIEDKHLIIYTNDEIALTYPLSN